MVHYCFVIIMDLLLKLLPIMPWIFLRDLYKTSLPLLCLLLSLHIARESTKTAECVLFYSVIFDNYHNNVNSAGYMRCTMVLLMDS